MTFVLQMTDADDPAIAAEVEGKLLVPTTTGVRSIARLTRLGPYPLRRTATVRLHSRYLDTPSLTLARNGVALRLRRQGRRWEATVKWAGRVKDAVHERLELTVPLPGPPAPSFTLPARLHTHLAALIAGRPLIPILISDVQRRLFDVLPSDPVRDGSEPSAPLDRPAEAQAPIAELALDRVRLASPEGARPQTTYSEVEIEGRRGERRDVVTLARLLRHGFGLLPSTESKLGRGLAMLHGSGLFGSEEPHVSGRHTVQEALRRIVARHLHRLRRHDPGTRTGIDPEALHDMRVATRRLRAAVRILDAGMPARARNHLSQELRWLGETLGTVRDLDVQLATLAGFTAAAPPGFRPALAPLHAYLDAERARRRTEMLVRLESDRYWHLLIRLERFASSPAPRRPRDAAALEPLAVAGRRAVKKAFRRLLERGAQVHAMPHPEDLHALRIRAKRLRYLLEFLAELTGRPGSRLVKRLTALQDMLGSHHDAVVAAEFVRAYVESAGPHLAPGSTVALGALVATELRVAEQTRADFESTWRRFAGRRTRDATRAVLKRLRRSQALPAPPAGRAADEAVSALRRPAARAGAHDEAHDPTVAQRRLGPSGVVPPARRRSSHSSTAGRTTT